MTISAEIPSVEKILFGRKLRSDLPVLPLQLINPKVSCIREHIFLHKRKPFYLELIILYSRSNLFHEDP